MTAHSRRYTIRYRLDGLEYTTQVTACCEADARDFLVDILASRLSALSRGADYRILSVTC